MFELLRSVLRSCVPPGTLSQQKLCCVRVPIRRFRITGEDSDEAMASEGSEGEGVGGRRGSKRRQQQPGRQGKGGRGGGGRRGPGWGKASKAAAAGHAPGVLPSLGGADLSDAEVQAACRWLPAARSTTCRLSLSLELFSVCMCVYIPAASAPGYTRALECILPLAMSGQVPVVPPPIFVQEAALKMLPAALLL